MLGHSWFGIMTPTPFSIPHLFLLDPGCVFHRRLARCLGGSPPQPFDRRLVAHVLEQPNQPSVGILLNFTVLQQPLVQGPEEAPNISYLFLVVQAFVVVFQGEAAFLGAGSVFRGGVNDVACKDFLPEGEAAARS